MTQTSGTKPDVVQVPVWMPCAVVALVGWVVRVHQVGPLSVYAESRYLPLTWYLLEQAISVGVTVAALGAGAVLFARLVPPLRLVVEAVCQARWPLALAAALTSGEILETFLPREILKLGGSGLSMGLKPLQWVWLVVMTLAVIALMLRAAWQYLMVLQLVVPSGWPAVGALVTALLSGELVARMLTSWVFGLVVWPP